MNSLFISYLPGSMRLAKTHQGRLEEFAWHRVDPAPKLNAIYLAEVTSVLPGIQGAFLDIGQGNQVFLNRAGLPENLLPSKKTKLSDVLKQGQKLVVQIRKPALEGKQPQVSGRLRLLGFFCVCLPCEESIRFSKKFVGDRQAFRESMNANASKIGWIIRSSAGTVPVEWVHQEIFSLEVFARKILDESSGKARLLWEPHMAEQWILDRSFPTPNGIFVDGEDLYAQLDSWLGERHPGLRPKLQLHSGEQRMFDVYKIQSQIEKAMAARVWLPSGGMLEIRQTPALVSIDVNSGKHTKSRGGVAAALRTNLEALEEIARQLRVRNLAGLVVVDLIDMKTREIQEKLEKACKQVFAGDDASIDLAPINRFGLLCLSRERRGPDLNRQTMRECATCKGTGWAAHFGCLAVKIQTEIVKEGETFRDESVSIRAHSRLANYLRQHHRTLFAAFEQGFDMKIGITNDDCLEQTNYRVEWT